MPNIANGRRPSADHLLAEAQNARRLRRYQTDPDVIALEVESAGRHIMRIMQLAIGLGFAFTTTNVQAFVADGAPRTSVRWWAAWLVEPMLILLVIATLRAITVLTRHSVPIGFWLRAGVLLTGAATYFMNTWSSIHNRDVTGIVLHSIPPVVIVIAVEAITEIREGLAEAAHRAAARGAHPEHLRHVICTGGRRALWPRPSTDIARRGAAQPAFGRDKRSRGRAKTTSHTPRPSAKVRNLPTAHEYAEIAFAKYTPGIRVDAPWVRKVTGCAKSTSYKALDILLDRLADQEALRDPADSTTAPPPAPGP